MDKEKTPSELTPFTSDMLLNTHPDKFEDIILSDGRILYMEKVDHNKFHKNIERHLFTEDMLFTIESHDSGSIWDIDTKDENLLKLLLKTAEDIREEITGDDDEYMDFQRNVSYGDSSFGVEYLPYLDEGTMEELESRE